MKLKFQKQVYQTNDVLKTLHAIVRGVTSDSRKINVAQIFKLISPGTEVKTI